MKTEVIIKNGHTKIVLKPENDFEIDVLDKLHNDKFELTAKTEVEYQSGYMYNSKFKNHSIVIDITKKQK